MHHLKGGSLRYRLSNEFRRINTRSEAQDTCSNHVVILCLCTRMAFHSESVNLLSKIACALEHGGGGSGMGTSPWCPSPQTEMEASVSVWECSSDVTGYTASSSNPAGTFTTVQTSSGNIDMKSTCYGINRGVASSASGTQSDEKKKKTTNVWNMSN